MNTAVFALLATMSWCSCPQDLAVCDKVDRIEINHFYDDEARPVFDQVIFYDWCDHACRFQVVAWRLVKDPADMPVHDWRDNSWTMTWFDGSYIRRVRARSYRETWTQYDPELREREYLPKERRRELLTPRVPIDGEPTPATRREQGYDE